MASMVEIEHAATLNTKDVIPDLVGEPRRRMIRPILMDHKSVFGLQAEDAVEHGPL
jgi:hypothetical protein